MLKAKPQAQDAKPWARIAQALSAADLLLQAGGFSAIVLDMAGIAPEHAARVPLATWFRYRAPVERTRASLLLLTQHSCAKSSAELQLRFGPGEGRWDESTVFTGTQTHLRTLDGDRGSSETGFPVIKSPHLHPFAMSFMYAGSAFTDGHQRASARFVKSLPQRTLTMNKILWAIDNELDEAKFERLCVDLLRRNGFLDITPIEPQDGGRDAEESPKKGRSREGHPTFFQFSKADRSPN